MERFLLLYYPRMKINFDFLGNVAHLKNKKDITLLVSENRNHRNISLKHFVALSGKS